MHRGSITVSSELAGMYNLIPARVTKGTFRRIPGEKSMSGVRPRELIPVDKSRDIRFLTIVSTLGRGGTERAAVNNALGYRRCGFPSAVYAYGGGGARETQLRAEGIPVFIGGEDPALMARAAADAREWGADILHLNRPGLPDTQSAAAVRALIHPRLPGI